MPEAEGRGDVGFLLWVQEIQTSIGGALGAEKDAFKLATDSLVNWLTLINSEGRQLTDDEQEDLCGYVRSHLDAIAQLPVKVKPKHHIWVHLTVGARALGNPRFYWTFLDESLNGVLKIVMRRCHQRAFERRVLGKAWLLFGSGSHNRGDRLAQKRKRVAL